MEECKTCTGCGETKPISEFYELRHNSIQMGGRVVWVGARWNARCKTCIRRYSREYNRTHRKKPYPPEERRERYLKEAMKKGVTTRITMKYIFESPVGEFRRCTRCKQYKPQNRFTRTKENKAGFKTVCKDCKLKEYHKYYVPKPRKKQSLEQLKRNDKERMFISNFLSGDGCCLYCGELNPWMLNNHHPWKRRNPKFTVTLCENHHAPLTRNTPFILTNWY